MYMFCWKYFEQKTTIIKTMFSKTKIFKQKCKTWNWKRDSLSRNDLLKKRSKKPKILEGMVLKLKNKVKQKIERNNSGSKKLWLFQ